MKCYIDGLDDAVYLPDDYDPGVDIEKAQNNIEEMQVETVDGKQVFTLLWVDTYFYPFAQ